MVAHYPEPISQSARHACSRAPACTGFDMDQYFELVLYHAPVYYAQMLHRLKTHYADQQTTKLTATGSVALALASVGVGSALSQQA